MHLCKFKYIYEEYLVNEIIHLSILYANTNAVLSDYQKKECHLRKQSCMIKTVNSHTNMQPGPRCRFPNSSSQPCYTSQLRDTESKDEQVNPRMRQCGMQKIVFSTQGCDISKSHHYEYNCVPIIQTYNTKSVCWQVYTHTQKGQTCSIYTTILMYTVYLTYDNVGMCVLSLNWGISDSSWSNDCLVWFIVHMDEI